MINFTYSPDGRYRYELTFRWAPGPLCGWIMLNPSRTWTNERLSPSGRRCVYYAMNWGYSGIVIRNRFAYRATDPGDLMRVNDPYGPENLNYLARAGQEPITVAAWGASRVVDIAPPLPGLGPLMCIGVNADGSPRHVLHSPADAVPRPWP